MQKKEEFHIFVSAAFNDKINAEYGNKAMNTMEGEEPMAKKT